MLACLTNIHSPTTCSAPVSAFCLGSAILPFPILLLLPGLAPALPTSERLFTLLSTHSPSGLHGGSQQSQVQNSAASGVEHFPGLCFEPLPYPRLSGRGWDSSGVCLTQGSCSPPSKVCDLKYRCFSFLGLSVLMWREHMVRAHMLEALDGMICEQCSLSSSSLAGKG